MLFAIPPDAALVLLTSGVLLIYVEMNRPGLILPGAFGLTASLLALANLLHAGIPPYAAAAGLLAAALFVLSTHTRRRLLFDVVASTALLYAFLHSASASAKARPHALVAVPCALLLGGGTSLLTTIAVRARQNKGLDLKNERRCAPGASPS